jgi:uncharacterized repeat protein (TIGR03803 family)
LYGTTLVGGAYGSECYLNSCGTVFQFAPGIDGTWNKTVLYSFQDNGKDGFNPYMVGLIFDTNGNLYGTTFFGGSSSSCNNGAGEGCGTVFQLTPGANGIWTEKILHSFNGKDGGGPHAGLIFDKAGNLYGTTSAGGANNAGTIFRLKPGTNGKWTEKVLHNFNGADGYLPDASLTFDKAGNLYSTTVYGGSGTNCGGYGCGTVFRLTGGTGGEWTEEVLHNFNNNGTDGYAPIAGVILDSAGNLYGTTVIGGANGSGCNGVGCGIVFRLAQGNWTENVLHTFNNNGTDGGRPYAGLTFEAGSLYGTTAVGGAYDYGTVFKLTPGEGGDWTEKVLHGFTDGSDGGQPYDSLILGVNGNLYGTTTAGGISGCGFYAWGCGTVFRIAP